MIINQSWDKQAVLENEYENGILLKIRDFVYNQSGLYFCESKFDSFIKKLSTRINALKLHSIEDYYF